MSNSLLNKSFTFQETRAIQAYVQEVVNSIVADVQALAGVVVALEAALVTLEGRVTALENAAAAAPTPSNKAKVVEASRSDAEERKRKE